MNQRDEYRDNERFERDRESNGGRGFYSGGHGFDESRDRGYEAGSQGRERDWDRWRGSGAGRSFGGGVDEFGHGSSEGRRGSGDEGRYGSRDEARYGPRDEGRWQWGRGAGWEPGRRGQGSYGRSQGQGYDWGRDRSSWREPYGWAQHSHWQDPFSRPEDTHYYGTGAPSFGGPGYTGGAAAYGSGRRDLGRELESEYSDESAMSYEHSGYPRQAQRRYPRGPKGYQRSDERMKEDISERLMESHYIDSSDVTVEVKGGMVTLEGTVPHRYMRHAIENIADSCLGVQEIDNRVRVKSSQPEQGQAQTSSSGTSSSTSTASKTRQ